MTAYRDGYFRTPGGWLHYLDWGDPSLPVAFLMHYGGGHAHTWDAIAEKMAGSFRAISIDARDHGDSDSPAGPIGMLDHIDDVLILAGELGADRFTLIGVSQGAVISMGLAARHPERVERLVVVDAGGEIAPKGKLWTAELVKHYRSEFASLDEMVEWQRWLNPYADEEWLRRMSLLGSWPAAGGKRINKSRNSAPRKVDISAEERWSQLASIACPTLIVKGDNSPVIGEDVIPRMLALMPAARAVTIPRAHHHVQEDNPQGFVEAVFPFLGITVPDAGTATPGAQRSTPGSFPGISKG